MTYVQGGGCGPAARWSVIARHEAIQHSEHGTLDCFASLAMTEGQVGPGPNLRVLTRLSNINQTMKYLSYEKFGNQTGIF